MNRIKNAYISLSIFWKFTLATVGVFFLFLTAYTAVQWVLLADASYNLEVKSLQEMVTRLQNELDDQQTEASDVIPFFKYYVNRNTHENLEINVINHKKEIIVLSEGQSWKSFISHEVVDKERASVEAYNGERYTVFRVPIRSAGGVYTVEFVRVNSTLKAIWSDSLYVLIFPGLCALFLSVLAGVFLSRQFISQIHELASEINGLKKDDFTKRLTMRNRKDELNQIRSAFNNLLDKVENTLNQQQQFIADASHELRTPVSVFKGHLQMLNRFGKSDEKILNESLERMTKEVNRFEHMIEDLLMLSKVEHTALPEGIPHISLPPHIHEIEEGFHMIDATIIFENNWQGDFITAITPEHFTQLLTIFIDNALKYTNEVPKKVRISLEEQAEYILMEIQDFGIGIPAEELVHVRERFFRVDKARSRGMGGVGLGLSIADRLIQLYDCKMNIRSKLDEGTVIEIYFKKSNKKDVVPKVI